LGVDPGSIRTGFGLIESNGQQSRYIDSGHIKLSSEHLPLKLGQIFFDLSQIIEQYKPQAMAIEQVFMSKNAGSALKLGQARGAAITAGVNADLPVFEYSAKFVKQAVVGYGAASKDQIQIMVSKILNTRVSMQEDEADAVAIALCHAHTGLNNSLNKMK
jgi:crossover junction endodeoxyribonuclease RuvC